MPDASTAVKNLRERLTGAGEDHLGKALSDLLDNPLLTGTIGRAFDAREKAAQAQELAMGALNIPSAADIERLTRRLRSVSQRLEGIEDGVQRLDRALAARGLDSNQVGERLSKIEEQLGTITGRLGERVKPAAKATAAETSAAKAGAAKPKAAKAGAAKPKTPKARTQKPAAKAVEKKRGTTKAKTPRR
jgi:hypothetical protein